MRREERALFEVIHAPDPVEDEVNVVAAVAPNFVQPAKCETGRFVKTHRRPDGDMRYGVARAVGFAENMGVAVVGGRFPVATQAREHGGAAFALVGPFAERVMHAVADGNGLSDERRGGADDGETRDDGLRP